MRITESTFDTAGRRRRLLPVPDHPSSLNIEMRRQFEFLLAIAHGDQQPGTPEERIRWEKRCISEVIVDRLHSFVPLNNGVEAGGQIIEGITKFIEGLGGYAEPEVSVSLTPRNRVVHRARLVPSRSERITIMLTLRPDYVPDYIRLKIVYPDDL